MTHLAIARKVRANGDRSGLRHPVRFNGDGGYQDATRINGDIALNPLSSLGLLRMYLLRTMAEATLTSS